MCIVHVIVVQCDNRAEIGICKLLLWEHNVQLPFEKAISEGTFDEQEKLCHFLKLRYFGQITSPL